jgi:hypothetical protein
MRLLDAERVFCINKGGIILLLKVGHLALPLPRGRCGLMFLRSSRGSQAGGSIGVSTGVSIGHEGGGEAGSSAGGEGGGAGGQGGGEG